MGEFAVPVSILLLGLILVVELARRRVPGKVDTLRIVDCVFALCFGVIPTFLFLLDPQQIPDRWRWILKNPFDDGQFLRAAVLALLGYLSLVVAYFRNPRFIRRLRHSMQEVHYDDRYLLGLAILLGAIGFTSLFIYAQSAGGFETLLVQASEFRSNGALDFTRLAFLKNVAPLILPASYIFYSLCLSDSGSRTVKAISRILLVVTFIASLFVLYHQAGRLNLISYLLVFPLVTAIRADKLSLRFLILSTIIFLPIATLGDQLFLVFADQSAIRESASDTLSNQLTLLMLEFSFPYVSLANVVGTVPDILPFRCFIDLPLALGYLLPDGFVPIELPATATMENTALFGAGGAVPVDLVSFGYFSFGLVGIAIVCYMFGLTIRLFEVLFPRNGAPVLAVFRVAWMMFLALSVAYADPPIALERAFPILVATLGLFALPRQRIKHS